MRKRKIKKIGGSLFLQLLKADLEDFKLKKGDLIDIENILGNKNQKGKGGKKNE